MKGDKDNPTRREFFRLTARCAALAALGAAAVLAGGGGRRSGGDSARRGKCINLGLCRGCSAVDTCHLPQAQVARSSARKS